MLWAIDSRGQQRSHQIVRIDRRATVVEITYEFNISDAQECLQHTFHRTLLFCGLTCRLPIRALQVISVNIRCKRFEKLNS